MALSQGSPWFRIRNQSDGPTQLHIYDEIGMLGVSASDLIAKLDNMDGPLDVHLNSPGGEVFEGLGIYNALLQIPDVTVYIDGLAASIASVIALAGKHVKIAKSGRMMIHDGFTMAIGNAADMRALADRLDFESDNIAQIYADHAGGTAAEWREVMRNEKWFNAKMAIEAGLAHEIIETRVTKMGNPEDNWDLSIYQNSGGTLQPGVVAAHAGAGKVKDAAHHPYVGTHTVTHEPMTGWHSHNHACFAFEDGDDGLHAHSHFHDNDGVHEHTHMSHEHEHRSHEHPHQHAHEAGMGHEDGYGNIYAAAHGHAHTHHAVDPDHDGDDDTAPDDGHGHGDTDHDYVGGPVRNAFPKHYEYVTDPDVRAHLDLHMASYDDSPWDGDAAMKAASGSSSPGAAFRAICAGKRNGPADERETWALPHHKSPGSPPNKAGVTAALGRLNQTDDLANKSAAQKHLEAHARAWADKSDGKSSDSGSTEDHAPEDVWMDLTDEDIILFQKTLRGE